MRADQLIGRLALRERPTNGDESYMERPVEIVGVEDGRVYYRPEHWSETDEPCKMIGWLDGWKPANCGGKRTVCLMADRFIWLVIKEADIEPAVDEIQSLGGFKITSAGYGMVVARKACLDGGEAIRKIKELVRLGWVWE